MTTSPKKELKILYSYSHKDQDYRDQLERHLSNLKRRYNLQTWFDRQIKAGDNWEAVLEENLNTADLIFLLISPDFMYSDYCYNKEMTRALERHARKEAKVIPIIVRRVDWKDAPFSHLQILPTDAKPVKSWEDSDEAYYDIVLGVEEAIQDLLDVIEQKAKDLFEKGNTLFELKHYEEALAVYEQAIHLDTSLVLQWNFILAYDRKGSLLKEPKSHLTILQTYKQAIHLNPNSALAYHGQGEAFYNLNRYEEALAAYDQAIRLDPNFAYPYNGKGVALRHLNRYEEALAAYDQAIRLDPNFAVTYNNKGTALYSLNRYEEALILYEQAIRLDPNFAIAYYNKGTALDTLNRHQEATEAHQKARELEYS
jgi:tetratricopeptide (TPR) repeat protein